ATPEWPPPPAARKVRPGPRTWLAGFLRCTTTSSPLESCRSTSPRTPAPNGRRQPAREETSKGVPTIQTKPREQPPAGEIDESSVNGPMDPIFRRLALSCRRNKERDEETGHGTQEAKTRQPG